MRKIILFLCFIIKACCPDDEDIVVLIDYEPKISVSWDEDYNREVVKNSLLEWEIALGLKIFELEEENPAAKIYLNVTDKVECSSKQGSYIGCAFGNLRTNEDCNIDVLRKFRNDIGLNVHEIGHCLTLNHDMERNSVMQAYIPRNWEILNRHVQEIEEFLIEQEE